MYRVLGALIGGRKKESHPSADKAVRLLASACRLLDSASPEVVNSVWLYTAAPPPVEAQRLAEMAEQLAAEHHLLATVQIGKGRVCVKFVRSPVQRVPSER